MTLWRYLAGAFLRSTAMALAALLALFAFLALVDTLDDVGKGAFTTTDAVAVVLLGLPGLVMDVLPVSCLLGSVLGLGVLANQRELLAIRAAGLATRRLVTGIVVMALAMGTVAATAQLGLVPLAERKAQEFRSRTLDQTARGTAEFWSRSDNRIVRVGGVEFGRIPRDIEYFEIGADGRLSRTWTAVSADILDTNEWRLRDVDERVIGPEQVLQRRYATALWNSTLSSEQLATLIAPSHALSPVDLYRYLAASRDSGVDTRDYAVRFWHQVSLPLAILAMMLLGLPIVLGAVQSRSAGFRLVIGAAIGIGFYLFQQITGQLALLYDVSPAVTATAPSLLVLVVSLVALRRVA